MESVASPRSDITRSSARQHELGAQASDRGGAEREAAPVEARELDHDREAQSRARLGLVEAAAAARDLLALLRRKAGAVVVDQDVQDEALAARLDSFGKCLDRHPRLRPFTGVVDQVADHLLQILPLAAKARGLGRIERNGD